MKVSEHLKKMHTAAAEHHARMAKAHKSALGKAAAMESDDGASEFHQSAMDAHTQAGEYHAQCAKDLSASMKADGMDNSDELMPLPTGLTTKTPDMPGVRAVPRAGMRPLPTSAESPLYAKVFGNAEAESEGTNA